MKAFLFDFDGVIADTERSNLSYMEKALGAFDIRLTDEERARFIGMRDREFLTDLFRRADQSVTMDDYLRIKKEVGNSYEDGAIRPMPGLKEFLCSLRGEGFLIGLASSTSSRLILAALNHMKLTGMFDSIVCGDMCTRAKPDPEIYLKVMDYLDVKPEECIVIEDSAAGIRAGKAAGAYVVAYRGSEIIQDVSGADAVLDSYKSAAMESCFK